MPNNENTILVIDDDQDVLMMVSFFLQKAGYNVLIAENGREGLEKAQEKKPVLAIVDRMMPELDGIEVCRRLRASGQEIFLIMLTAMASEDDRITGLEAGVDDYITKPFSPKEVVLRVQAVLRRGLPKTETTQTTQPAETNTINPDNNELATVANKMQTKLDAQKAAEAETVKAAQPKIKPIQRPAARPAAPVQTPAQTLVQAPASPALDEAATVLAAVQAQAEPVLAPETPVQAPVELTSAAPVQTPAPAAQTQVEPVSAPAEPVQAEPTPVQAVVAARRPGTTDPLVKPGASQETPAEPPRKSTTSPLASSTQTGVQSTMNKNLQNIMEAASQAAQTHDYTRARELYLHALSIDRGNENALLWLAWNTNDPYEGCTYLERLVEAHPENAKLREFLEAGRKRCRELDGLISNSNVLNYWNIAEQVHQERLQQSVDRRAAPITPLGQILLKRRLITPAQLETAVSLHEMFSRLGTPKKLGEVLMEYGYVSKDQLKQVLYEQQLDFQSQFY